MLRKKRADLPMCLDATLGSERIADAKLAAASASLDAAAPLAAASAESKERTLLSFFLKPPAG